MKENTHLDAHPTGKPDSSQSITTSEIVSKEFLPVVPPDPPGPQQPYNANSGALWKQPGFYTSGGADWVYQVNQGKSQIMTLQKPVVFLEWATPTTLQVLFQFSLLTWNQNGHYWQTSNVTTRPIVKVRLVSASGTSSPIILGVINCSPNLQV